MDDYYAGRKYGLPITSPVADNGCFKEDVDLFAGEHVFKANARITQVLAEHGRLLAAETVQHSYPHCWRHKSPVIFRATPQWFFSLDGQGLRAAALDAVAQVRWTPAWGERRIHGMVSERGDWCISRQRTWGSPIAVFVDKETGAPHPETPRLLEAAAQKIEQQGIDAWFELDPAELLGAAAARYEKATDTLDVWFDSGVTHATVLERDPRLGFPADLYLEGSDQHRGWFQSSLLTAVGMRGQAPYRNVLTHGFAVDAKGMKMSKSAGNVVSPQQVTKTLGADVLRLWTAAADYRNEMSVSDEILKRMADAYRRIRNTARYLLANLHGFDPVRHLQDADALPALDRWALAQTHALQEEIRRAYEDYQFHVIYQKLHHYCIVTLGNFYLDVIKDRMYTLQEDSPARRSAQTAMFHIIEALTRWLAPILSFTADEIWQHLPGKRGASVFLEEWYDGLPAGDAAPYWDHILQAREDAGRELERLRVAGDIGSGLDARVDLYCDGDFAEALRRPGDELRFIFITSYAEVGAAAERPPDAAPGALDGLWLKAAAVDFDKCARCWHRREDVGAAPDHPELCGRCLLNVTGEGEVRRFA